MNIRDWLNNYDVQEGDLLECENGEVYEIVHTGFILRGPKPRQHDYSPTAIPKRLLRPRWEVIDYKKICYAINLELLKPKQQALPTITVNVPKGVKVEVVEK